MENLLNDKALLRSLLQQGDLANTINGGASETYISAEKGNSNVVIKAFAAGVHSSDFKVTLNKNRLILSRHLNEAHQANGSERLLVPAFMRYFDLPSNVEKDGIEAYYEGGVLRVIVPMQREQDLNRDITIKEVE